MELRPGHRKLVKHYEDPGHVRELTFSCYRRMPLLTNDTWREMLSRAIDRAGERHQWRLAAFVFMPEHVHLLSFPEVGASGSSICSKPSNGRIHIGSSNCSCRIGARCSIG
jgi:hypothetical protein